MSFIEYYGYIFTVIWPNTCRHNFIIDPYKELAKLANTLDEAKRTLEEADSDEDVEELQKEYFCAEYAQEEFFGKNIFLIEWNRVKRDMSK